MRIAMAALLLGLGVAGPAAAQIHIDIGIHLPKPPSLVIVPGVAEVRYDPGVDANLFVYEGQFWIFVKGGWHVSRSHQGPWIVVQPHVVPRPLLLVPVRYYKAPPGHWRGWKHDGPPRWGHEWGPEWASKRGWKDRDDGRGERGDRRGERADRDRDDDRKGPGKERGKDRDRGGEGRGQGRGR